MTPGDLLPVLATLFVTVDPVGLAPIFLSLTRGATPAERRRIAAEASVAALIVLVVFALGGSAVLGLFGISLPAFRTAGGLLLFAIAFEMIFERRRERHEKSAERSVNTAGDVAIFPLAIPLLAGPGAISAVILLASANGSASELALLIAAIVTVIASSFLVFLAADRIDAFVGESVQRVLTRVLGIILAALAVQFVADGVRALATVGTP